MDIKETLKIENFLSIAHLVWEPKEYNIITGEMGSGKSICIKLLYFIYDIFNTIFSSNFSIEILNEKLFYRKLNEKFNRVFYLDKNCSSHIEYNISSYGKNKHFNFKITIDKGNVKFTSPYIEEKLPIWKKISLDISKDIIGLKSIPNSIYNDISSDIGDFFPFDGIYFPDNRILLSETNNIVTTDPYTNELLGIKGVVAQNFEILVKTYLKKDNDIMSKIIKDSLHILHIKNISFESGNVFLLHDDNRKVPLNKSSSGQKELFSFLAFINLMQTMKFENDRINVLLVEEPESHLFPNEQKMLLELLTRAYRILNKEKLKWRFFITTHSPYIINVLNNMLLKGEIISKNNNKIKDENIPIPHLTKDEISGIFLNGTNKQSTIIENGCDGPYFFIEEIEKVTSSIDDDYNMLLNYLN